MCFYVGNGGGSQAGETQECFGIMHDEVRWFLRKEMRLSRFTNAVSFDWVAVMV